MIVNMRSIKSNINNEKDFTADVMKNYTKCIAIANKQTKVKN